VYDKQDKHLAMSENQPTLVLQNSDIQNYSDMAKVAIKYELSLRLMEYFM